MKEASRAWSIPLGTFHTYYHRSRNLLSVASAGLDPDSPPIAALLAHLAQMVGAASGKKKKPVRTRDLSHLDGSGASPSPGARASLFPDEEDFPGVFSKPATDDEIEMVVARVIRPSQYPPEQKERLLLAVARVIRGDLTINASANSYQLPSRYLSTLALLYCRLASVLAFQYSPPLRPSSS